MPLCVHLIESTSGLGLFRISWADHAHYNTYRHESPNFTGNADYAFRLKRAYNQNDET
jgi:hypothetical protein